MNRRQIATSAFLTVVCISIGYLLWSLHFIRFYLETPIRLIYNKLDLVIKSPPEFAFVSDVNAFASTIIALAVPLGYEIISRISERYNSDHITQVFENEWSVKLLTPLLLMNIVSAVITRVLMEIIHDGMFQVISAGMIMLLFLIELSVFSFFLSTLKKYYRNIDNILSKLYEEGNEILR